MRRQKFILIKRGATEEVDKLLAEGWLIKCISAFCEPVSVADPAYVPIYGAYGCYVVLEKEGE